MCLILGAGECLPRILFSQGVPFQSTNLEVPWFLGAKSTPPMIGAAAQKTLFGRLDKSNFPTFLLCGEFSWSPITEDSKVSGSTKKTDGYPSRKTIYQFLSSFKVLIPTGAGWFVYRIVGAWLSSPLPLCGTPTWHWTIPEIDDFPVLFQSEKSGMSWLGGHYLDYLGVIATQKSRLVGGLEHVLWLSIYSPSAG